MLHKLSSAVFYFQLICICWFVGLRIKNLNTASLSDVGLFAAVGLALLSLKALGKKNFSVFPPPKTGATFVGRGIYGLIRHPMYLAVLLAAFSVLTEFYASIHLIIFLLLAANMVLKIYIEENFLLNQYPDYKEYMRHTKRLLPFIW